MHGGTRLNYSLLITNQQEMYWPAHTMHIFMHVIFIPTVLEVIDATRIVLFDFIHYFMKIKSKSPSRVVVRNKQ